MNTFLAKLIECPDLKIKNISTKLLLKKINKNDGEHGIKGRISWNKLKIQITVSKKEHHSSYLEKKRTLPSTTLSRVLINVPRFPVRNRWKIDDAIRRSHN